MGKKKLTKAAVAAPVRTDLDLAKLSGPVKQAMVITYKAHYRDGKVIQGNLETDSKSTYTNKLVTYGKDGNKTREEKYNFHGRDITILNKNKNLDEMIHLDLKGTLVSRTVFTHTKHNQMRDTFSYNGDGSLSYKVIKTFNDDEHPLEEIQYQGADETHIISRSTYIYDDKGRILNTTYYDTATGKVKSTYDNIYNEEGKIIESKNQHTGKSLASMNSWYKQIYNEQGDCTEHITLNNDGS